MKPKANTAPVIVATPNTTEQKMQAIVNLSQAVRALSDALTSAHVDVQIENCTIVNAKKNGIEIGHS